MTVTFQQGGGPDKSTEISPGASLLEAAGRAGVMLDGSCGGRGTCGRCRVRLPAGTAGIAPPDPQEATRFSEAELAQGWRLACRVTPVSDITVSVPARNAEASRKQSLARLPADFAADSPAVWSGFSGAAYGAAFDIGTTTVVGTLCDLKTGTPVRSAARTNPQSVFGADVISRIHYASQLPENLADMQGKIIGCLNGIIGELAQGGVSAGDIRDIAVVGNTAMSHLFLGVDASPLARSPFAPVFTSAATRGAAELGLNAAPGAKVYLLPNIAGHVGSDITGVMLASALPRLPGASLAVDIGTNGEILLCSDGKTAACSTAAGPAFEGASIFHGMRAAAGAVEGVEIAGGDVRLKVIGGGEPVGICGSGLIDAVAALLGAGVVSASGRMLTREAALEKGIAPPLAARLYSDESGYGFALYRGRGGGVLLTQKDIREVQLAKGAIAAGINILMKHLGVSAERLDRVMVAGAFGSYIKVESALRVGLLPPVPPGKVLAIGNAAGAGACMALLSSECRETAEREAAAVGHVELASRPEFVDEHMKAMYFPE